MKTPNLKTQISNVYFDHEKKKSVEIISLLKKTLPQEICGFKLKKVELFDYGFGDYRAEYIKKNSDVELGMYITINQEMKLDILYSMFVCDALGHDHYQEIKSMSNVDSVAKKLLKDYATYQNNK
ncbi:MAG: hypothetical protein AABY22_31285 [Nanoarchaeota archaeon]